MEFIPIIHGRFDVIHHINRSKKKKKKKKTEDPINRCKESIKKMKETSIYGKFQVDLE